MALGAEVVLTSTRGKRSLPLESFFLDYYQTALEPGEIMSEIRVPPPRKSSAWAHIKFTPRTQEDFATVGVALTLHGRDNRCEDIRLALNSVGSTIFRAKGAEEVLRGTELTDDLLVEVGKVAASEADPMDDLRGSAEYKRELIKVLVQRALTQACERLGRTK